MNTHDDMVARATGKRVRHILSVSGGKDSTALAIYMRDKVPEMEYVFCDTGEELPETYDYLGRLEVCLGKPITVLRRRGQGFADLLAARRGFLPSPQARWCTQYLKIEPFEAYAGEDSVVSYIALRADEPQRKGYLSSRPNISARYPFIEDDVGLGQVLRILKCSGVGLPEYYAWRSRSGCYLCFFQRRIEWVGLLERHPHLFWKAASFEREDPTTGERYTWNGRESLAELARPERVKEIKASAEKRISVSGQLDGRSLLTGLLRHQWNEWKDEEQACLICRL